MQMVAAQAPTYTYAVQAAPQMVAAPKAACGGDGMSATLQEAMVKALVERMAVGNSGTGGAAAPSASPAASVDDKLSQLEQKINELTRLTDKVGDILTRQDARIKALEGK